MTESGETRRITIERTPAWQLEYDREIRIKLRHNAHQTSHLHLSRVEAATLLEALRNALDS